MATVTKGKTFISGETVEPADLHQLVDSATVTNIVNADIKSDAAIAGTKIAPDFGSQNVVTTGGAVVGHTQSVFGGKMEVFAGGSGAFVSVMRHTNDAIGPALAMIKTRGTTADSKTIVQSGDSLGSILWQGTDGSSNLGGASIAALVDGTPGTNDMPGRLVFSTTADGASSVTERMRITSDGDVLMGTTSSFPISTGSEEGLRWFDGANNLYVSADAASCVSFRRTGNDGAVVLFYRGGTASSRGNISVTTTATAYNTSSDYRLKENPTPLTGGLALIEQVRPVEFDWKGLDERGRGFIAHELQAVVPEAVTGEKDAVDADGNPEYQGVDAAKLVPYLVSAVQELKARVEALEAA